MGRKGRVMKYRRFTQDFKRSIVEQLLSETATPTELCRRYNISSGQLYTWRRQYTQGKLDPEPSREAELAARVRELERMLSKVTLENEFLKKAVRNSLKGFHRVWPLVRCFCAILLQKTSRINFDNSTI
jgi:transposase